MLTIRHRMSAAVILSFTLAAAFAPAAGRAEGGRAAAGPASGLAERGPRPRRSGAARAPDQLEASGTLSGAGMSGTFHTWLDGERERDDQSLGPRAETTLRLGPRVWFASDGAARELTGILLRRARTQRFIDSGDFAAAPERCAARGRTVLGGPACLRARRHGRRRRDGDPRSRRANVAARARRLRRRRRTHDDRSLRLADGRRSPLRRADVSDGDRAFDVVQRTASLTLGRPVDAVINLY